MSVRFGLSVLNSISANKQIMDFVLYDCNERGDHILHSIFKPLPTDVRRRFTTGVYNRSGFTYPCIHLSASGESNDSVVVVYSSLVDVYSSLVCLQ